MDSVRSPLTRDLLARHIHSITRSTVDHLLNVPAARRHFDKVGRSKIHAVIQMISKQVVCLVRRLSERLRVHLDVHRHVDRCSNVDLILHCWPFLLGFPSHILYQAGCSRGTEIFYPAAAGYRGAAGTGTLDAWPQRLKTR
nr:MAG TPA: hypothetical protein [Caudoviricetes sp.]